MAKSKRNMSGDFRAMYLKNHTTKNPESELDGTRMEDGNLPLEDHNWDELNEQLRTIEEHYKQKTGEKYIVKGKYTGTALRWQHIHDIYVFLDENREWLDLPRGAIQAICDGVKITRNHVKEAVEFMKRNNLLPKEEPDPAWMNECDQYNYIYYI